MEKAKRKKRRQRESNAAHRAKTKAERWAANDGHKYPKRICEQCDKEFYPNSTRQRFCNTDCTKVHQQAEALFSRLVKQIFEKEGVTEALKAEKSVMILNDHTGGKATCKDKAKCEVCGAEYGELDPKNHTNLKHFPAKAATKTTEGNIEYWYCDGCGKYYSDKDGTKEIKKAETVTAKLKDDSKSPQTGDSSNFALWLALLFVSGGAAIGTTIVIRKKTPKIVPKLYSGVRFWAFLHFGSKSAIRQHKGGVLYAPYAEIPQGRMGVLS